MNFTNKAIIVTGGGSGIGKAITLEIARAGGRILIVGRNIEKLKQTAFQHDNIEYLRADLANTDSCSRIIQASEDLFGRLDVLINNAGMFKPMTLDTLSYPMMEKMFRVNVITPAMLAKEALPLLKQSKGHIINIGSSLGHIAGTGQIGYGTSKGALEQLTRNMAQELGGHGIKVNCIAPGPTQTDILKSAGLTDEMIRQSNKEMTELLPLGRRGLPEEVAMLVLKVCDPMNRWLTGQVISIDGGMSVA